MIEASAPQAAAIVRALPRPHHPGQRRPALPEVAPRAVFAAHGRALLAVALIARAGSGGAVATDQHRRIRRVTTVLLEAMDRATPVDDPADGGRKRVQGGRGLRQFSRSGGSGRNRE